MEINDNTSMDDILKSIREAILEKERKAYFQSFLSDNKMTENDVFLLSKNMLVKREDIPYDLGVWNFEDVAKKMMKKYRQYFTVRNQQFPYVRVRVKEDKTAL